MNATVLICTWNRAAELKQALNTIGAMKVPRDITWEVIVVDNNSPDDTRRVVEAQRDSFPTELIYLFEPKQGKSHALNTGIAAARGEVIVFTDDDVKVEPNWLAEILAGLQRAGSIAAAGRIVAEWTSPRPSWYADSGPYRLFAAIVRFELGDQEHFTDVPAFGANLAIRRDAFQRFGLFREDLLLLQDTYPSGEDTEYCRRLLRAGEKIVYLPKAVVHHPVAQERTHKRYFLRYYFNWGKTNVRVNPDSTSASWFGVPRYLFRELVEYAAQWFIQIDEGRRFFFKLQCWRTAGSIAEHLSGRR